MHVSLTPHWKKFVEDKLNTGRYKSASEVIREALRLLEESDEMYQARLADLRHTIEIGRKGDSMPFDSDSIKRQARQLRSEKTQ